MEYKNENIANEAIDQDIYSVYYWRHGDTLGKGSLSLFKNDSKKAIFEIYYEHKPSNVILEGNYTILKGLITVRLHDKKDKEGNPSSQIVFLSNPSSIKDCYIGTYSTAHRGATLFPVAGAILLFRKEDLKKIAEKVNIEQLSTFFLRKQKFKTQNSGFDFINLEVTSIETDNAYINSYFEIIKYVGIYKGSFINPKRRTYETCLIKIYDSTDIEMLVDANLNSRPFKGVARLYSNNKNLIVSYDFREEINDYRMKLIFDVSRYHLDTKTYLYGIMSGLELMTEELMTSTMVVKKLDMDMVDLSSLKDQINVIDLDDKKKFRIFERHLKTEKLDDFFFGKKNENFTSVALLNKMKQSLI